MYKNKNTLEKGTKRFVDCIIIMVWFSLQYVNKMYTVTK